MDDLPTPESLLAHVGFVRTLARALVRDEHEADDVAQETLLAALRRPPGPGNLRGWLAVVARRLVLRRRRGVARERRRMAAVARCEEIASTSEVAASLEIQRSVVEAVVSLDEPYRSAIHHRYYEGRSPAEMARALGVPVGTVKTWLKRARRMLRARLDRDCGGRGWAGALAPLLLPRDAVSAVVAGLGGVFMASTSKVAGVLAAAVLITAGAATFHLATRTGSDAERAEPSSSPSPTSLAERVPPAPDPVRSEARPGKPRKRSPQDRTFDYAAAYEAAPKVSGVVLGPDGRGLPGVEVAALYGKHGPRAVTDAEGRFFIRNVYPADIAIARYVGVRQTPRDVVVVKQAKDAVQIRFQGIAGSIVAAGGKPVTQGIVIVRRVGEDEILTHAKVDATGRFALFGLQGGPFDLDYKDSYYGSEFPASDGSDGIFEGKADVALRILGGASIEGVVYQTDGDPAELVWMRATLGTMLTGDYTDEEGRFTIEGLEAGRSYQIMLWKSGFVPEVREVLAGTHDVRFDLDPGGRASGRVLDAEGEPVRGWQLLLRTESGVNLPSPSKTDKDGRFSVAAGLPDEPVTVFFVRGEIWRCGTIRPEDEEVTLRAAPTPVSLDEVRQARFRPRSRSR